VTAAPVWALRSSPAYDAAAMDGIAVRAADTFGATETTPRTIATYHVVDTGDALPEGCDAVVMREHVHWEDDVPEVRAAAAPWQHVRTIGEDLAATELLLPEGHRLRPANGRL
jgi:putative molybdopterin biosynthesis protein